MENLNEWTLSDVVKERGFVDLQSISELPELPIFWEVTTSNSEPKP